MHHRRAGLKPDEAGGWPDAIAGTYKYKNDLTTPY